MKGLFLLLVLSMAFSAQAAKYDAKGCFDYVHKESSFNKKYTYYPDLTAFTGDFSNGMTEGTTRSVDSKVITKNSTVWKDMSSSKDTVCNYWMSLFASMSDFQIEREQYIVFNLEKLKEDIAMGGGEYLNVLAYYAACDASSKDLLASELQKNYGNLEGLSNDDLSFSKKVDEIIKVNTDLNKSCLKYN